MRKLLHADQRLLQNLQEENLPALHQEQFRLGRELGLILNQGNILSPILKYRRKLCIFFVIHNMCIEKKMEQFWRIKENLQKHFPHSPHWSDSKWKACLAGGGGGNKKRFQYCTDSLGTIVYFRALQGHSGRNLIDPSLQDNVIIQRGFFQHIYHIGCAF